MEGWGFTARARICKWLSWLGSYKVFDFAALLQQRKLAKARSGPLLLGRAIHARGPCLKRSFCCFMGPLCR